MTLRSLLLTGLALIGSAAGAHATTFDLSGSPGSTPSFSITAGGNTATFTSVPGNQFVVGDTTGLLSFSTALEDLIYPGTEPLVITFSKPVVDEILIPFAILDAFGTGDTLTTITGAGTVQTFSATSTNLTLGEPEGLIAFVPTNPLTQLTLINTQQLAFAIGNVTVPEPMSLSLLGTAVAGAGMLRRKKRAA